MYVWIGVMGPYRKDELSMERCGGNIERSVVKCGEL